MADSIVIYPDARLSRRAQQVSLPRPAVDLLVEELLSTMRAARGLGLAAPQIGIDMRVAVVEVAGSTLVLINPKITRQRGHQMGWEGCLSVPHMVAQVPRPAEVVVSGLDLAGRPVRYRGDGLTARAIVHEIDHLEGRLYVDLVDPTDLVDVRENPTPPTSDPIRVKSSHV